MSEDEDDIRLPSGRTVYANRGIIGIGPELGLSEGYDGGLDGADLKEVIQENWGDTSEYKFLPFEDRLFICDMMLSRWNAYREKLIAENSIAGTVENLLTSRQ